MAVGQRLLVVGGLQGRRGPHAVLCLDISLGSRPSLPGLDWSQVETPKETDMGEIHSRLTLDH